MNESMDANVNTEEVGQEQTVESLELRIWQQALGAYEQDLDTLSAVI